MYFVFRLSLTRGHEQPPLDIAEDAYILCSWNGVERGALAFVVAEEELKRNLVAHFDTHPAGVRVRDFGCREDGLL